MQSIVKQSLYKGVLFLLFFIMIQFVYGELIEKQFRAFPDQTLHVILDVDAGEIIVQKSDNLESGLIIAEYNSEEYRSKIDFDEERNKLKIILDKRNWRSWSHGDHDNQGPVLKVHLPRGVDILMNSRIKAGEVNMHLGLIRMKELVLSIWAGELNIDFNEVNPRVMEFFEIDAKVGEMNIEKLGNARFERADINGGIGELFIDFKGDLISDSRAKVDFEIGEATIVLPKDIGVRMSVGGGFGFLTEKNIDDSFYRRGNYYYSEEYDSNEKRLSLRVSTGLGELRVERE